MARNDKRRFGDRKDGRMIRSLPAFSRFIPYIMPTRNDASNLYEESMEVSAVDRRLRKLRVRRPSCMPLAIRVSQSSMSRYRPGSGLEQPPEPYGHDPDSD